MKSHKLFEDLRPVPIDEAKKSTDSTMFIVIHSEEIAYKFCRKGNLKNVKKLLNWKNIKTEVWQKGQIINI